MHEKRAAISLNTLILTMYFLWSKGEDELNFSIFWKPVICTKESSRRQDSDY